jgi:hypothetical protein
MAPSQLLEAVDPDSCCLSMTLRPRSAGSRTWVSKSGTTSSRIRDANRSCILILQDASSNSLLLPFTAVPSTHAPISAANSGDRGHRLGRVGRYSGGRGKQQCRSQRRRWCSDRSGCRRCSVRGNVESGMDRNWHSHRSCTRYRICTDQGAGITRRLRQRRVAQGTPAGHTRPAHTKPLCAKRPRQGTATETAASPLGLCFRTRTRSSGNRAPVS